MLKKMKFIFVAAMLLGTLDLRASDGPHYTADLDLNERRTRVQVYLHEEDSISAMISIYIHRDDEIGAEVAIELANYLPDGGKDAHISRKDSSRRYKTWCLPPTHKYGNAKTMLAALNAAFPELGIQDGLATESASEGFYEFLTKCSRGEGMTRCYPSLVSNMSRKGRLYAPQKGNIFLHRVSSSECYSTYDDLR